MKTYLFFILFFSSFLTADILYVKNNRCILDDYYFQNARFNYDYSSTGRHASSAKFKSTDLEYGYEFVNNKCKKIQVIKDTGLSYQRYKFLSAFTGLLIGFTIFISVIFIFIKKD